MSSRTADYATGSRCPNCSAVLTGPYCAHCGQHAHHSARGFGALLHDGWETLTHIDGRLWATLVALLFRPGRLTLEYFQDRRARYIPPVRLYLIISLVFFALLVLGRGAEFKPAALTAATMTPAANVPAMPVAAATGDVCSSLGHSDTRGAQWLQRVCTRLTADHGASWLGAMRDNLPRMMFLFLPLLAAAMQLLYWRPRRLYVQHLVFLLHAHAALYLLLLLIAAADWLARAGASAAVAAGWLTTLLVFYALWYPYRGLRNVYQQGRTRTVLKYTAIALCYLVCLTLTLALTAAYSALVV